MSIETNKLMNLADGKVLYDDLRGRSEANKRMIAPAFAEGTANSAGSYVTYEGGLYLLPNGHTANVTWANTTKTAVTVGGDLSNLKSQIDGKADEPTGTKSAGKVYSLDSNLNPVWAEQSGGAVIDDTAGAGVTDKAWSANKLTKERSDFESVTGNELIEFTDGLYIATNKSEGATIDLTPVAGGGTSSYAIVNCSEGDRFTINGTGGSVGRLYAFVDEDDKLIAVSLANITATNRVLLAPPGSAKLILCIVTNTIGMCCKGVWISGHVDRMDNKLLPKNLAEGILFVNGKYIYDSTGIVTNSSTGRASRSIDVSAYTKIVYPRFAATGTQHWGAAFYDEDGEFVSGQRCITSADENHYVMTGIDVPQTAKYFRWTELESMPISELYEATDYYSKQPKVQDVQINGTSVVTDGVANVPIANGTNPGVVKVSYGLYVGPNGDLTTNRAVDTTIKAGSNDYQPIVPNRQHTSVFYGLSKVAGVDLASGSDTVGVYPENAKSAISQMLNAPVSVTGTTPTITAKPGVRYICGEVATLDITIPASGCIDVVFESGSTATVLTITGTVKWANGFDPTSLDVDTTYEINIMDGLGVACAWT